MADLLYTVKDFYDMFSYLCNAVVIFKIKLFWNNFEIIPVFYFTRNHVWNYFKIVSATLNMLENIHELQ